MQAEPKREQDKQRESDGLKGTMDGDHVHGHGDDKLTQCVFQVGKEAGAGFCLLAFGFCGFLALALASGFVEIMFYLYG